MNFHTQMNFPEISKAPKTNSREVASSHHVQSTKCKLLSSRTINSKKWSKNRFRGLYRVKLAHRRDWKELIRIYKSWFKKTIRFRIRYLCRRFSRKIKVKIENKTSFNNSTKLVGKKQSKYFPELILVKSMVKLVQNTIKNNLKSRNIKFLVITSNKAQRINWWTWSPWVPNTSQLCQIRKISIIQLILHHCKSNHHWKGKNRHIDHHLVPIFKMTIWSILKKIRMNTKEASTKCMGQY